ncbi:SRPBCC domain-containing protein [Streptosporangiaceae bacterium NEAU-GS5]|nr:SRPBCC domain-containing protein [Streptosporangiaceae bacterium NEAU-GS5]
MRVVLTGHVHVGLPPDEAFVLFTPRGEERWVPGWHPHFPAGALADDTEPGTVFQTHSDTHIQTTWIVTDCAPGRHIAYARHAPSDHAGRVTVTLHPSPGTGTGTGTSVEVTYDLTALNAESAERLQAFADGFPPFLQSWETALRAE